MSETNEPAATPDAPAPALAPEPQAAGFAALGLDARLVATLAGLGYEEPTPIQRQAIPPVLAGRDLVGQAATGTGKTAAFALPLLHRIAAAGSERARPSAVILVPTRELAMQVAEAAHKYGRGLGTAVLPVYGGQSFDQQVRALRRGVDVVVATPGRAHDHLRRGTLSLAGVSAVVLDEADEMFDMGFAEDLDAILAAIPAGRQTLLFSATMPPNVAALARRHLTDPADVRVVPDRLRAGQTPRVRQTAYVVPRAYKLAALGRVLDVEAPESALVFCRTRGEVEQLAESLGGRGYRAEALHGGMSQEQRDRVMRLFRAGTADLLVATDVAARGLDIDRLTHVVNYHVPPEAEAYVHRIGRVGRAGREGVAITLAEPREHRMLREIERATGQRIEAGRVPTVADLRARRLEMLRAGLREAILAGGLDQYRVVVESLAGEFDVMDVALAAAKLAHQAEGSGEDDAEDIPPPPRRDDRPRREERPRRDDDRFRDERPRDERGPPRRDDRRRRSPTAGMVRLFIGAGREAGVLPRDLVGAIANESGLPGRDIGGIEIADRFSIVEVPEEVADYVIENLDGVRLKGRRVVVRRDRRDAGG